ncbi:MAG: hypothetical protein Q4F83_11055 [Eubacteriales bacterium]|nr:hypothetical protein [Eubacteriales bacterium]
MKGHNCHLCKKEWIGRCFDRKHYGKDVSVDDTPICSEYEFGGTEERLREIKSQTETILEKMKGSTNGGVE